MALVTQSRSTPQPLHLITNWWRPTEVTKLQLLTLGAADTNAQTWKTERACTLHDLQCALVSGNVFIAESVSQPHRWSIARELTNKSGHKALKANSQRIPQPYPTHQQKVACPVYWEKYLDFNNFILHTYTASTMNIEHWMHHKCLYFPTRMILIETDLSLIGTKIDKSIMMMVSGHFGKQYQGVLSLKKF